MDHRARSERAIRRVVFFSFTVCGVALGSSPRDAIAAPIAGKTELVSCGVGEGDGISVAASLSANGRFIAFESAASNLVAGDSNGKTDIFVHDRKTNRTLGRVSVDSAGNQASGACAAPSISASGRFVAFDSSATNLVGGDGNGSRDVFVHDRKTRQTTRVSVDTGGGEGNGDSSSAAISADGRYVVFSSDATDLVPGDVNGTRDVFVHDRKTGETKRVSVDSAGVEGNDSSDVATCSASGRFVAFRSAASNLVSGDGNAKNDIFVHDLKLAQTTRVSIDSAGAECNGHSLAAAISATGRYVVFDSFATNLVAADVNGKRDVFVHDRLLGTTTRESMGDAGNEADEQSHSARISLNGRFVVFGSSATNLVEGDTNAVRDVYVRDRKTARTTRMSIATSGDESDSHGDHPVMSANGRYVAFDSFGSTFAPNDANGQSDVFLRDRLKNITTRVSMSAPGTIGNVESAEPTMSAAGRYVAFTSRASNLVPADTNDVEDIFVRDRRTGETTRISVSSTGAQSNGASVFPSMSANGRYVSFHSWANNLVDGDANGVADVFVHDRTSGLTIRVSVDSLGTEADLGGSHSAISANGRYVVFESSASNLVAGITDALGQLDVFVHDLKKRETTRVSMNGAGFPPNGHCGRPSISANGRCVAFQSGATNLDPADSNGVDDVFVHDRKAGWTRRVSIRSDGAEQTEHAFIPTISASGRHISFHSLGSFVGDDTNGSYDVFVHDLKAETTTRASVASDGTEANSDSFENSLSANGRYVAFYSFADNLTNDDSGDHPDVFVHDRKTGKTFRVSTASSGAEANGDSSQIKLSGNGRFAAFASTATNLSSIDTNDAWDVFVRIVK